MATIPKDLTKKFLPGLGDQHVVGLDGLGYSRTDFTLVLSTSQTDAEVIASPPNTSSVVATGVMVHSLGQPPTAVIPMIMADPGKVAYGMNVQYITADNSAVYLRAYTWTGAQGGVSVRVTAMH